MIHYEYNIKVFKKSDKVRKNFKIYNSNLNRKLSNFMNKKHWLMLFIHEI